MPARGSHRSKNFSRKSSIKSRTKEATTEVPQSNQTPEPDSQPFVVQWNCLVSTTNWEKGRIICQWRDALVDQGAPASEYSDEAWANLVGGVTGQHVGRLRRAFQQFGSVYQEYPGLYWSHFQVAMDWDDAEMWLEGAVQNRWSVSQMRAARWEAHGAPDDLKPRDEDIIVAQIDEDSVAGQDRLAPITAEVRNTSDANRRTYTADENEDNRENNSSGQTTLESPATESTSVAKTSEPPKKRPFANLPTLPADVAEAFEQFKLAILTHKVAGWSEIARDDMLAVLEALKELAMLPADGADG